jgi:hypothetical protein
MAADDLFDLTEVIRAAVTSGGEAVKATAEAACSHTGDPGPTEATS